MSNFLKVFKVNALPATLEPSSMYLIPGNVTGQLIIAITDKDGVGSLTTSDTHFFNDRLILNPVIEATPVDTDVIFLQNNRFVGSQCPVISPEGRHSYKLQSSHDDKHIFWIKPLVNNSGVPQVLGIQNPTIVGTRTTRTINFTADRLSYPRLGIVSAASAGSLSSLRIAVTFLSIGSSGKNGFFLSSGFMFSDAAAVAGARAFIGLRSITSAPTNVEPSTLLNSIGVAALSNNNNLVIISSNATTTNTPIDLGANFPVTGLSQNLYKIVFNSDPVEGGVHYYVKRIDTGNVAEGYIAAGSIPPANTGLTFVAWRSNNATAKAVGLDLCETYIEVTKRSA